MATETANYVHAQQKELEMTTPPAYNEGPSQTDGANTSNGQTNIVTMNNKTEQQLLNSTNNNNNQVIQPMDEFRVSTSDVSYMTQISTYI